MKQVLTWVCVCMFFLPVSRVLAATNMEMSGSIVYRVVIPHYFFEYKIPKSLKAGYGGVSYDISFENTGREPALPFGDRAATKTIATYFFGVVGDFSDYDLTVEIFVLKAKDGEKFASLAEIADYAQRILSKPFTLKNGAQVTDFGKISDLKIGPFEVVAAKAADMYHITEQRLRERTTTTFNPYTIYFIRLDDEVVVGIRVEHHTQKRLSARWHGQIDTMMTSIIRNLKFTPRDEKRGRGLGFGREETEN